MFEFSLNKEKENFKIFSSIDSVADIIDKQMPAYYDRPAIYYDCGDDYKSINFELYQANIMAAIQFLMRERVEQKVIATFCMNRPEWDMFALATFYTANMLFPLDTKTNSGEITHLLKLNPPDYWLVSRSQVIKARKFVSQLNLMTKIIVADSYDVFEDLGYMNESIQPEEISVKSILNSYDCRIKTIPSPLLHLDETVLGHYPTSGTTDLPKVVQITHRAIIDEINEATDVINLRPNEHILNIGPYTHIATLVEFLMTKTKGFPVAYFTKEPDEDDVLETEIKKLKKQGLRIKALMAVPKFWIYIMKELLEEMKNKPILHNLYLHLMSIEKNQKLYDIGTIDKAKLTAMKTLLRNKLGGYFSFGASSSMKLDSAVVEIFGKLGITVIDIYGATEASGIISRNKLNDIKLGSCGKIIKPLNYRISNKEIVPNLKHEIGELEIKGNTLMHSYLGKKKGSHLNSDGYFATGDLCWIDKEGYLFLVGRKKDLIRWHDWTYIDPQHLSNLMVRNIYIKDAMVTKKNKEDEYLSVYVYPDFKRIENDPRWQKEIVTGIDPQKILKQRVKEAIDYTQSVANITARIDTDQIFVLTHALERTPTHKIKFNFELKRLHEAIAI